MDSSTKGGLILGAILLPLMLWFGSCLTYHNSAPIVVSGYVRNVWCYGGMCHVSFEAESGETFSLHAFENPPVWAGFHCRLTYHRSHRAADCDENINIFDSAERIP